MHSRYSEQCQVHPRLVRHVHVRADPLHGPDKNKNNKTIVSNESGDIVLMFNSAFEEMVPSTVDLYPEELRSEVDELNEWVHNDVSNGVNKCGFASSQEAYDEAVGKLFDGLNRAAHRFLVGDRFTEADLRLFTTLIRFDEVYAVHFKANKKLIEQYPHLSNYVREIYQMPPITKSMDMQQIKLHYYASHTHLNAFGIIPAGHGVDFSRPHNRNRFENAILPIF